MKSPRNKTIDFPLEGNEHYLKKCLASSDFKEINDINVIINGDTFETLSKLQPKSVDLLIVDPPYNLTKNYHGNTFKQRDKDEYLEFTIKWVEMCIPLLKETATIYICSDWKTSVIIGELISKYFNLRNRITWEREKGRGSTTNWKNSMEDIWYATMSSDYVFNYEDVKVRKRVIAPYRDESGSAKDWTETEDGKFRDTFASNFWSDISIPYWSMPENTAHPTQKPEKLLTKLILASSNEGDLILDPFSGSGSTCVTAKKLNRNYIGIEMNPQYCAWTQKRLEMAEDNRTIQGYADNVFWERNTSNLQR